MKNIGIHYLSACVLFAAFLCQVSIGQAHLTTSRFSADSINVRSFGAKGDDITNDSAAFETAIKYAAANRKVLFVPKGRYRVSNLLVYANCTIAGKDSNSVLILANSSQSNRQCLLLTGLSQNVTLKNLKFDANRSSNTGKNIFCVHTQLSQNDAINNLTILNCCFTGSKNYGALFLIGTTGRITHTKIIGCNFYNSGSAAVSVRGVNGFVFSGNRVSSWSRADRSNSAFAFQSQNCSNIIFTKNYFKNADAGYFAIECAGAWVMNGRFTDNVFDGNGYDASGISGFYSHCIFKNNRHINGGGSHRSGYELVGDNDTITNNIIEQGSISIGTGAPGNGYPKAGSSYIVTGNKVSANFGLNNNCMSIGGIETLKGALVANNIFDNSLGKGNAPVIALGQRGAATDIVIKNNTLKCAPGNSCIRMKIATGPIVLANITITRNQFIGESAIQVFDTKAYRNINISGNDLRKVSKAPFIKDADFTPDFHLGTNINR